MLWNQIDISTDLIGIAVVKIAAYPKATNKEFASTTVVCNGISVTQINQEARWSNSCKYDDIV